MQMNRKRNRIFLYALFFFSAIAACATPPSTGKTNFATAQAPSKASIRMTHIKTGFFALAAYTRIGMAGGDVTIYIEGDGNAWVRRHRLSNDPTPKNPVALMLSLVDPSANVAYLARPGQYPETGKPDCPPEYWSQKRFSAEVISSMNEAIDIIAKEAGAEKIHLVGFSGGAAVAVLVASRRSDIASLRTVAGNLDPAALNEHHRVSVLSGSLDPMDFAQSIKNLPQRHFTGARDRIVPLFIAKNFIRRMGDVNFERITVVENTSHTKGWQKRWRELLNQTLLP